MTVAILVVYWDVLHQLASVWYGDDTYSHGFFIVPLAAYFAWERRHRLANSPIHFSWFGLFVVVASIVLLIGGLRGVESFISRISFLTALAGAILLVFGWQVLRVLAFPLAFMLLMIPPPAAVFSQVVTALQLLASNIGEFAINALDIPVLRQGNMLILANTTLEVAQACSGIRSLIALFTLGLVFGSDPRTWVRVVIAVSAIPIAILFNGLRVASAGVAAHYYGSAGVEGLFHAFSGWVVFLVTVLLMMALQRLLIGLWPPQADLSATAGVAAARRMMPTEEQYA